MSSTGLNNVCVLPGKDVTLNCALPDSILVWSSPELGQQEIHSSTPSGDLDFDVQLQLDNFVYDLNTSYICVRARATILDIDEALNELELTCSTTSYDQCQSIFSSTFMISVIGEQFKWACTCSISLR